MGEALPDVTLVDALFRSSVIGVALLDSELRYVRINEALAAVSQRPVAEHLGEHVRTLLPALAEVVQPWLSEVLRTRRPRLMQVLRGARHVHGVLDILPYQDGLLLIVVDNTALLYSERVLLARLRLSELLSEVSAGFIELRPSEMGTGITRALQAAAEAFDVDRALVVCFSDDHATAEVAHRWEREPSERPEHERFTVEKKPDHAGALQRLSAGHDVVLGVLTETERSRNTHLAHLGELGALVGEQARSLVAMPLRMGREIAGLVCFACLRRDRDWPSDVLTNMRVIVEIIASAMHRQQQEERIEERLRFEALVARLSREFVSASLSEMDTVVPRALQTIGTARPFSRAVIYRRDPSEQWLELWHEWLAPGMPSLRPTFPRVSRAQVGYIPPAFFHGEGVVLDAESLDPDAHLTRRIMQDNVRLIAIAPLLTGGQELRHAGAARDHAHPAAAGLPGAAHARRGAVRERHRAAGRRARARAGLRRAPVAQGPDRARA
jgi:GAF domain-containing protein